VRRYTVNRGVERSLLGLKSQGALVVTYAAEFSFGYDLAPGSYDVVDAPAGIEIRVASPTVVAAANWSRSPKGALTRGVPGAAHGGAPFPALAPSDFCPSYRHPFWLTASRESPDHSEVASDERSSDTFVRSGPLRVWKWKRATSARTT